MARRACGRLAVRSVGTLITVRPALRAVGQRLRRQTQQARDGRPPGLHFKRSGAARRSLPAGRGGMNSPFMTSVSAPSRCHHLGVQHGAARPMVTRWPMRTWSIFITRSTGGGCGQARAFQLAVVADVHESNSVMSWWCPGTPCRCGSQQVEAPRAATACRAGNAGLGTAMPSYRVGPRHRTATRTASISTLRLLAHEEQTGSRLYIGAQAVEQAGSRQVQRTAPHGPSPASAA
jgi:hypothetical protein